MGNLLDCTVDPLSTIPTEDGEDGEDKSFVLQPPTPLRQSIIWQLQREFYASKGISAWSDAIVPNFVTTNAFIARAYAKVVVGVLKDVYAAPGGGRLPSDPSKPVYIVELGAGHGKFGFLMLDALLRLAPFIPKPAGSASAASAGAGSGTTGDSTGAASASASAASATAAAAAGLPFKYIMTDHAASNVAHWKSDSSPLAKYVEMGLLDFAVFNAETDTELKLEVSGAVVSAASTASNPVIAICNYVFDSLTTDAFRVENGVLKQAQLGLATSKEEENTEDPDIIKRMQTTWEFEEVDPATDFYGDAGLNDIVRSYAERHKNASFLIPLGGLRLCRNLMTLSNNRLVMLVGDKGYNYEEELEGHRVPHIAVHGSFSFMVNFHAVKLFFDGAGGSSMHTPHQEGFKVASYFLGGDPADWTQARWAFKDGIQACGGAETFSTIQRSVKEECMNPTLKHVLALLRLSCHDADVFLKFKQVLIEKVAYPYATELVQSDVRRDIDRVHATYYPLQSSKDVCFEIGRLLMGLKEYETAIEFFQRSNEACGVHHVTWHNIAICEYYRDRLPESQKAFRMSLSLRPSYREAKAWLEKVTEKLAAQGATYEDAGTDEEDDDEEEEEEEEEGEGEEDE